MKDFQLAPPDDPHYVVREADAEFERALREGNNLILIHGPARTGKSALLARGLKGLQAVGHRAVLLDLATAPAEPKTTKGVCRFAMREIARQLGLPNPLPETFDTDPPDWNEQRLPIANLERYLRRRVLTGFGGPFYLFWDALGKWPWEARANVYGLTRSWLNDSAVGPDDGLGRMKSVVAYSEDRKMAEQVITEFDSPVADDDGPFSVPTDVQPTDFTEAQVAELNRRTSTVLVDAEELERFLRLVGGQPFLVRTGLEYLRSHGGGIAELEAIADRSDAPWSEFLEWLGQECDAVPRVRQVVVDLTVNRQPVDQSARWAAHGLGLLADDRDTARLRCDLYRRYFARRYGA